MEFTAWMDTLFMELPRLLDCVKTNAFPERFLTRAMNIHPETVEKLPEYLTLFMGLYLLCGLVTIVLRFKRGQRSINSFAKQLVNVILTSCCVLIIPLIPMLAKACIYVLQNEVTPCQGLSDLGRFIADSFGSIFYLLMALGGLIFTAWIPLGGALTYLRRYQLFGLPHMIFDSGTGMYLMSVYLLSSYYGQLSLYLLLIPALVMLRIIQIGGYIPEEINAQAAVTGKNQDGR